MVKKPDLLTRVGTTQKVARNLECSSTKNIHVLPDLWMRDAEAHHTFFHVTYLFTTCTVCILLKTVVYVYVWTQLTSSASLSLDTSAEYASSVLLSFIDEGGRYTEGDIVHYIGGLSLPKTK